jgi:glycosyltransferase involved in cell wall biosynthesis
VDDLGPNAGTERQIEETVKRLDRSRLEVHVCCFADSDRLRRLSAYVTTAVFPLDSIYSVAGLRQMGRFRGYLRQNRIHVVHGWMAKSSVFAVVAALGCGCAVVTSRLNTGYWYTPYYISLFRLLNRGTTRIFSNSEAAKRRAVAAERVSPSKVDVIYNGVDMTRFSPQSGDAGVAMHIGIPENTRVVGIVANLRPVKDLPLFLRAASIVARQAPRTAFVVVGQGPLRAELGRLACEIGLQGTLFFSDGYGSVPDYLQRMCIGCLSSETEGFSNAILEYMAAGLPVIATDAGGNAEALADGVTGYLVRERTPEAFALPIVRLLENEEERAAMGHRGLERCRELFSIEVYGNRMQRYYEAFGEPLRRGSGGLISSPVVCNVVSDQGE